MNQESVVTDNWEDIDETELEKRLEQEKQERIKKEQEMAAARQNGLTILSNGGDDFRPRILQRPKPVVTILKRPDSSNALSSASQQNLKPQLKTLEQREKEYAEARLRILGSAVSDESPTEQSKQLVNLKISPSSSSNYLPNANQSQPQRAPENVVRLPKGPTPGQGFNIRR